MRVWVTVRKPVGDFRYSFLWPANNLSERAYQFRLVALWLYAAVWGLCLLAYAVYAPSLSTALKVLLFVVVVVFVPPFRDMVRSYEHYILTRPEDGRPENGSE